MIDEIIKVGTTSKIIEVWLADSSSTTGAGLTGLLFNAAGFSAYYSREDQGNVGASSITLATMTKGTWATGGFVEKDATNEPGVYQFSVPDAVLASGAKWAKIMFKGATNLAPKVIHICLTAIDLYDTVRAGMTALPNAAAEAAGGLFTRGTGAGQINQPANGLVDVNVLRYGGTAGTFASGRPEVNTTHVGGTIQTAGDIPARLPSALAADGSIKSSLQSILGTAFTEGAGGRIALAFKTMLDVASSVFTVASVIQTGDSYARLGAPAGASLAADVAGIKSDTGGLVTKFGGITLLKHWLGMLAGKQAADATALTEIKASGAGSGTYDPTTDSLEANRDNLGTNGGAIVLAKTTNITGFNDLNAATVKTQVTDSLSVDATTEPTSPPASTAAIAAKLNWVFAATKNKRLTTATSDKIRNDADGADIGTSTLSDDTTTFTRGKYA